MHEWYMGHYASPYPTPREFELMAAQGNINVNQVKQWFVNIRRRTKNEFRRKRGSVSQAANEHEQAVLSPELNSVLDPLVQRLDTTQNDRKRPFTPNPFPVFASAYLPAKGSPAFGTAASGYSSASAGCSDNYPSYSKSLVNAPLALSTSPAPSYYSPSSVYSYSSSSASSSSLSYQESPSYCSSSPQFYNQPAYHYPSLSCSPVTPATGYYQTSFQQPAAGYFPASVASACQLDQEESSTDNYTFPSPPSSSSSYYCSGPATTSSFY